MKLKAATTLEEAEQLARLAETCWRHHYIPIIGLAQVDYMLEKYQSAESILQQIADGRKYAFILGSDDQPRGYIGYDLEADHLFLSKFYILPDAQRQGIGQWALDQLSQDHPDLDMHLTVNKNNHSAIAFYEQNGFIKNGPVVADIGQGYVMDDWKMVRLCKER